MEYERSTGVRLGERRVPVRDVQPLHDAELNSVRLHGGTTRGRSAAAVYALRLAGGAELASGWSERGDGRQLGAIYRQRRRRDGLDDDVDDIGGRDG